MNTLVTRARRHLAAVAALAPIGPAEISDESRSDLLELARLLGERRA